MADHVRVPIKVIGTERWGQLSFLGDSHLICGESVKLKDENFSYSGGHRVRLYSFKKNVAFKIPAGISVDIAEVPPASTPRRSPR
jgi:hypothetical protein